MEDTNFNFNVKKRFVEFCGANKIPQRRIANEIGISYNNINTWFNLSKDTMPTIFAIGYLAKEYDLSANWLISGVGSMKNNQKKIEEEKNDLVKMIKELTGQIKELTGTIKDCVKKE